MVTAGAASKSSDAVNARPMLGAIPSIGISDAVTRDPPTRSGLSSSPARVNEPYCTIAISWTLRSARHAPKSNGVASSSKTFIRGNVCQTYTSLDGSRYGRGRSSTASTRANTALLTPSPSAMVAVTSSVKPGRRAAFFHANRKSPHHRPRDITCWTAGVESGWSVERERFGRASFARLASLRQGFGGPP